MFESEGYVNNNKKLLIIKNIKRFWGNLKLFGRYI